MKVLSIKQPWAHAIIQGWKPVENRTWSTQYRGEIGIHAGKAFDHAGYDWICYNCPELLLPHRRAFPTGGIIGKANLIDVVKQHESKFFFGPYGFVLADAAPLPFRAIAGQLGFFEVKDVVG